MQTPKFNVSDVLKPILDDTGLIKCHVVEVQTQECPARIEQIFYLCRVHTKPYKSAAAIITANFFRFNEIELEPWTAKVDSGDTSPFPLL